MNNKYNTLAKAVRFATLAAIATPATVMAGGFSLNEQSAATSGYANAGAAAHAEDASTVFFNPAGMSKLSGTNVSFGASYLDIDAEAKGETIYVRDQTNQNVTGSNGGDIADPAILPSLFVTHEVNDSIDVGFALHAPYGLAADYDDDFRGRYFADETELSVISFSPSLSASNGKGLSMGIGMNIMYAEGTLSRFIDNSGTNANAQLNGNGVAPNATDQGYANVEGDDVGVTFRIGFLYEFNEDTQAGLSFQTGTELELEGDATFTNVSVANSQTNDVAVPVDSTEPVVVPLNIPESVSAGIKHKLTDDVTLLAGATYAKWSRFKALNVKGTDSSQPFTNKAPGGVITHIPEEWNNTWQFNVGGIWQATPKWQLKAGYAYDETPVDEYVTARIPSSDRHWLTLGTQWKDARNGWKVDASVGTLIFKDDPKVDDNPYILTSNGTQPNPQDTNSTYQAEYDLSAWSAALQVSKAF